MLACRLLQRREFDDDSDIFGRSRFTNAVQNLCCDKYPRQENTSRRKPRKWRSIGGMGGTESGARLAIMSGEMGFLASLGQQRRGSVASAPRRRSQAGSPVLQ